MTPEQITLMAGSVAALLGAIGIPTYAQRLKAKSVDAVGTKDIAQMYREEVDRLQKRLDDIQAAHTAELAKIRLDSTTAMQEMQDKWSKQHLVDQDIITTLRGEVDALYRRLYSPPPTHA